MYKKELLCVQKCAPGPRAALAVPAVSLGPQDAPLGTPGHPQEVPGVAAVLGGPPAAPAAALEAQDDGIGIRGGGGGGPAGGGV